MFSEAEIAYLKSQYLARLGTVSSQGQPTVAAVGFELDGTRFYIGGLDLPASRKYRNVAAGNQKVSLIIDDLESVQPWKPRQIKVHGLAEIVERAGRFGKRSIWPSLRPYRGALVSRSVKTSGMANLPRRRLFGLKNETIVGDVL